jgi:hypothetical protein
MSDNLTQNILDRKKELDESLINFNNDYRNVKGDVKKIQTLLNDLIKSHSDLLNTVSVSIGQSHQLKDFFYNKDLQDDYVITTKNFLKTSFSTLDVIQALIVKHSLTSYKIGESAYYTPQKLINTFADKKTKKELIDEFTKKKLPVSGFQDTFNKMKNKHLKLQLWIGIPLIVIFFLITFLGEQISGTPFNGIQLIGLKALLALSFSIVGSTTIEGQVETDWTLKKGLSIRAVGWLAVFLLLYFLNPASPGDVH